jgi:heme-degrading monooxygenase HmoA
MIMRVWKGRVPARRLPEYMEYMDATGLKEYAQTPGNLATYAVHRIQGDVAEVMMVTLWDNVEAIQRFTGPDHEKAQYYPRDPEFLLEMEPKVAHYEVASERGNI